LALIAHFEFLCPQELGPAEINGDAYIEKTPVDILEREASTAVLR
jgi:hypothetical protein